MGGQCLSVGVRLNLRPHRDGGGGDGSRRDRGGGDGSRRDRGGGDGGGQIGGVRDVRKQDEGGEDGGGGGDGGGDKGRERGRGQDRGGVGDGGGVHDEQEEDGGVRAGGGGTRGGVGDGGGGENGGGVGDVGEVYVGGEDGGGGDGRGDLLRAMASDSTRRRGAPLPPFEPAPKHKQDNFRRGHVVWECVEMGQEWGKEGEGNFLIRCRLCQEVFTGSRSRIVEHFTKQKTHYSRWSANILYKLQSVGTVLKDAISQRLASKYAERLEGDMAADNLHQYMDSEAEGGGEAEQLQPGAPLHGRGSDGGDVGGRTIRLADYLNPDCQRGGRARDDTQPTGFEDALPRGGGGVRGVGGAYQTGGCSDVLDREGADSEGGRCGDEDDEMDTGAEGEGEGPTEDGGEDDVQELGASLQGGSLKARRTAHQTRTRAPMDGRGKRRADTAPAARVPDPKRLKQVRLDEMYDLEWQTTFDHLFLQWWYIGGVPFERARMPEYRVLTRHLQNMPRGMKPTLLQFKRIAGSGIQEERAYIADKLCDIREQMQHTGATILTDGRKSLNSEPIVNFLAAGQSGAFLFTTSPRRSDQRKKVAEMTLEYIYTQTGFDRQGDRYRLVRQQLYDFHARGPRYDWGGDAGTGDEDTCEGPDETQAIADWWVLHGSCAPELCAITTRLMYTWFYASPAERNWVLHERIHEKRRNGFDFTKLTEMVEMCTNKKLLACRQRRRGLVVPWGDLEEGLDDVPEPRRSGTLPPRSLTDEEIARQARRMQRASTVRHPPAVQTVFGRRAAHIELYHEEIEYDPPTDLHGADEMEPEPWTDPEDLEQRGSDTPDVGDEFGGESDHEAASDMRSRDRQSHCDVDRMTPPLTRSATDRGRKQTQVMRSSSEDEGGDRSDDGDAADDEDSGVEREGPDQDRGHGDEHGFDGGDGSGPIEDGAGGAFLVNPGPSAAGGGGSGGHGFGLEVPQGSIPSGIFSDGFDLGRPPTSDARRGEEGRTGDNIGRVARRLHMDPENVLEEERLARMVSGCATTQRLALEQDTTRAREMGCSVEEVTAARLAAECRHGGPADVADGGGLCTEGHVVDRADDHQEDARVGLGGLCGASDTVLPTTDEADGGDGATTKDAGGLLGCDGTKVEGQVDRALVGVAVAAMEDVVADRRGSMMVAPSSRPPTAGAAQRDGHRRPKGRSSTRALSGARPPPALLGDDPDLVILQTSRGGCISTAHRILDEDPQRQTGTEPGSRRAAGGRTEDSATDGVPMPRGRKPYTTLTGVLGRSAGGGVEREAEVQEAEMVAARAVASHVVSVSQHPGDGEETVAKVPQRRREHIIDDDDTDDGQCDAPKRRGRRLRLRGVSFALSGPFQPYERVCYNYRQPGHFARNCPYPRREALISGTPIGGYGAELPPYPTPHAAYASSGASQSAYAPSAPPMSQALVLQQHAGSSSASASVPISSAVVPYRPSPAPAPPSLLVVVPWAPRQRSSDGEVVSLLRELVNDRREEKDRRREVEDRQIREEQARLAKEEEGKRLEEEEMRQAEKEARMATMINAKMEELDEQHQARTKEENKKIWKEIEKVVGDPKCTHKGKEQARDESESRKRQQAEMEGSPPVVPAHGRARCENPLMTAFPNLSPLDAGLLLMELDNVKRSQDTQVSLVKKCMEVLHKIEIKFPSVNAGLAAEHNAPPATRQQQAGPALISGTPIGGYGARLPPYPTQHTAYASSGASQSAYAPSAPPMSQAPVLQQHARSSSALASVSISFTVVPYRPSPAPTPPSLPAVVPYAPRQRSSHGEVVSLLRELVNDRREEKDRGREVEDRQIREEQARLAKEEEGKRLEEEEMRQAEKKARMAMMINA
ncbi:hypothetical protein CBR_g39520 [Chara braunii]|uniref:CCHC-type domain-containing protein n=1 Tax=Chara braunii TaxID=69332 RepID=A0A388LRX1_CHABU|nr:hypothetical protein CBR_g39520 [Chara braunii]|eukprot:GBG85057.1 hypothetical protein CBR_g39520 [Chara braunii]